MWARKLKLKLAFWLLQKTKNNLPSQTRRLSLEVFDTALFTQKDIGFDCVYDLEVIQPNLLAYLRMINAMISSLERQERIDLREYSLDTRKVSIEAFFKKENRTYLDRQESLDLFLSRLRVLLDHYGAIELEQIGNAGYNARSLTKIVRSLMGLIDQLRRYSTL